MDDELPPKPDPRSGKPRPPAAPLVLALPAQPTTGTATNAAAPEGRGPALEVYGADRKAVLIAAAVFVGLYVLALRMSEGSWTWLEDPVHWGLMTLLAGITIVRDWKTRLVAGSDWVQVNRRWVDTYALTDITLRGIWFGWMLRLRDAEGRSVRTYITNIEPNRELWALVYNGMAHSVRSGARINNLAAGMLRLRPGFESIRTHVYRPAIPNRTVWTFLLVLAAVFGATYLFRPDLLGIALMVFAAIMLVLIVIVGTILMLSRRRENTLDAVADEGAPESGQS